jgi:predicted MFS family arabinose efflux permease
MSRITVWQRSPYRPVLSHRLLRRVLPGLAVSALGDGMALVAVTWLALELAPAAHRGAWVAVAIAAYTLPSAAGAVLFGRLLAGRSGAQLAGWDATLRASALAAIPLAHATGVLDIKVYAGLLAVSSLLHSWGTGGRYTRVAELLPPHDHLAANAVLALMGQVALIAGPPLAGVLIAWHSALSVIAIDAASFAVLAATYRFAAPRTAPAPAPVPAATMPARHGPLRRGARTSGLGVIRRDRSLLALFALNIGVSFLFGPVYVAMPAHLAEAGGTAATLGAYYTVYGAGAVAGGLVTGYLRRWSPAALLVGIVTAFGAALLPLGLGAPAAVELAALGVAGLVAAPYLATVTGLFQRRLPTGVLPQALATVTAAGVVAGPLGTLLGGPLVTGLGARATMLISAVAILALGIATAAARWALRHRARSGGPRADFD